MFHGLTISLTLVVLSATAVAQPAATPANPTIPFPKELGLEPIEVPKSLIGKDVFPIPAGYAFRASARINCEDKGSRAAVVTEYQQDGRSVVQKITASYTGSKDTGTEAALTLAAIDTPAWIETSYTKGFRENISYVVSADKALVTVHVTYAKNEGVFHIMYAKEPTLLK